MEEGAIIRPPEKEPIRSSEKETKHINVRVVDPVYFI
jgi:hypothetical protein